MNRIKQIKSWLTGELQAEIKSFEPASKDASFRRYFRVFFNNEVFHKPIGHPFIIMDAPPGKEDIQPFIDIAEMLQKTGVNVPVLYAINQVSGFILMSDLGSTAYLSQLNSNPASADKLYGDALQALVTMQKGFSTIKHTRTLPLYDEQLLQTEMNLLPDWYIKIHCQQHLTDAEQSVWQQAMNRLILSAQQQPQVFVHRDYHSRNLMLDKSHQLDKSPGIIDFQDAVIGPVTYDLVSLLRDSYIAWPDEKVSDWVELYRQMLLKETYDRSTLINNAVDNLKDKLIEEFIVVALVCLIFLFHFRSVFVVVISLPIGILTAFIVMNAQGITANIMSLGGIAIAIGAMVDASIVMMENVHKHFERFHQQQGFDDNNRQLTNKERWQVIAVASKEVGPALFFSLLIITISFIPVFSLQAQEGKLFTPLAFTKTYAMAAAALLSITLVPVLMGYFIRGKIVKESNNPVNRLLIAIYKPFITLVLKFPKTIILLSILVSLSAIWPMMGWAPLNHKIGNEFMPDLDEGDLMYMPTTFPSLSIGKAKEILQQTNKLIMKVPEVRQTFGKIGRAETATDPAPLTMIETLIRLKPREQWREGMDLEQLKQQLNKVVKVPSLSNAWVMPIKTRIDMLSTGIKTPIGIKISGDDLSEIEHIGRQIEKTLLKVAGTSSVFADKANNGRYITVDINRQKAARLGLTIKDVQIVVSSAIGGLNISESVEGLERYPINVRYPQVTRDSVAAIKLLPVIAKNGAQIALGDVADIRYETGPPMIKSENARLNGWVFVDISERDIGSYVKDAKQFLQQNLNLPAGYSITWSGQFEYLLRAQQRMAIVVPLALMIIIVLLYLNFKNFADVLMILGALPMSLVGGVWLLYWLDFNFSVAVWIGFIALAGVAAETGVIMLVYLKNSLQDRMKSAQLEARKVTYNELSEAIVEGALLRIRPKVMTVAAIIAGLLPIMLTSGTGSEVMQRIAAPMVGGMISAMMLTLLVIPAIFFIYYAYRLKKDLIMDRC